MGVTNRDASLLTQRNRNRALYSYKAAFTSATMTPTNGGPSSAAMTGPATTGAETLIEANLGCRACTVLSNEASKNAGQTYDLNTALYEPNASVCGASSKTGTS